MEIKCFTALARVGNYSISNYINYLLAKPTNAEASRSNVLPLISNLRMKANLAYRDQLVTKLLLLK
jgi:hypothetical protein